MLAYLGIEPSATVDNRCNGAVFMVDEASLAIFDHRERNYDRIDVTEAARWPAKPDHCHVYTYAPNDISRRRLQSGLRAGIARVRDEYLKIVENAFRELGTVELSRFRETTPAPPCAIEDIKIINIT